MYFKMKHVSPFVALLLVVSAISCNTKSTTSEKTNTDEDFPATMVQFSPNASSPIFQGTGADTWDKQIRERGYILYEDGLYRMWYSGYNEGISEVKYLGYATSKDGLHWVRFSEEPILKDIWVEDMHVIKHNGLYYMLAEGRGDITHLLTSTDGITWDSKGDISIFKVNGEPISEGPYGTPTMWIENGKIYLYYERNDEAIWLATSTDFINWINVQDEAVLEKGPGEYDAGAVATNQIIKYEGKYYMFYHGSSNPDWMKPGVEALWTSNLAMSTDLIHWTKYPQNPIVEGDHSSPILVFDGNKYSLFTLHDKVWRYDPK